MLLFVGIAVFFFAQKIAPVHSLSAAKSEWINNSLRYYNQITRGSKSNNNVAVQQQPQQQYSPTYLKSAMENYFAREKIKENKPAHAESIYRRLMDEFSPKVLQEECECSHLAVPTLPLGLLLQREGRPDDARVVFEGFDHVLEQRRRSSNHHKRSCSARVL